MKRLGVAAMLCLAGLIGCDDAEETVQNLTEQEEIQGRFASECVGAGISDVTGISKKDEIDFNANQVEVHTIYYSSSDCDGDSEIGTVEYNGEFIVEQNSSDDGIDQGLIQFELEDAMVIPSSETLVDAFNTINYCGADNYEVNEAVEITENTGDFFCPVREVPASLIGVYYYDTENDVLTITNEPSQLPESGDLELEEGDNDESSETAEEAGEASSELLPIIQVFAEEYMKQ